MKTTTESDSPIQLDHENITFSPGTTVALQNLGRISLALLSAGLLICSLPSADIGFFGWIALVPLLIASADVGPVKAAGLGFVSGFAANFGIFGWLFEVPGFG